MWESFPWRTFAGKLIFGMATLTSDSPSIHTQQPCVEGKNILITGGTTGNGRAIAALLAGYGANVFVFGRDEDALHRALAELQRGSGKAFGITADQARVEDIERVFARFDEQLGPIDILVNNAAVDAGDIMEWDDAAWRYGLEVDLFGYIDCTRRAVHRMRERRRGHIVNIGSIAAEHFTEGESLYVAAKSAIRGFSRSLRKELSEQNIKVSLIEPGLVGTEILERTPEGDPDTQRREQARGAMLKPEDIAVAVHYILTQPDRCTISLLQIEPMKQD